MDGGDIVGINHLVSLFDIRAMDLGVGSSYGSCYHENI